MGGHPLPTISTSLSLSPPHPTNTMRYRLPFLTCIAFVLISLLVSQVGGAPTPAPANANANANLNLPATRSDHLKSKMHLVAREACHHWSCPIPGNGQGCRCIDPGMLRDLPAIDISELVAKSNIVARCQFYICKDPVRKTGCFCGSPPTPRALDSGTQGHLVPGSEAIARIPSGIGGTGCTNWVCPEPGSCYCNDHATPRALHSEEGADLVAREGEKPKPPENSTGGCKNYVCADPVKKRGCRCADPGTSRGLHAGLIAVDNADLVAKAELHENHKGGKEQTHVCRTWACSDPNNKSSCRCIDRGLTDRALDQNLNVPRGESSRPCNNYVCTDPKNPSSCYCKERGLSGRDLDLERSTRNHLDASEVARGQQGKNKPKPKTKPKPCSKYVCTNPYDFQSCYCRKEDLDERDLAPPTADQFFTLGARCTTYTCSDPKKPSSCYCRGGPHPPEERAAGNLARSSLNVEERTSCKHWVCKIPDKPSTCSCKDHDERDELSTHAIGTTFSPRETHILEKKTKCKPKCQKLRGGGTGCYCRDPPTARDDTTDAYAVQILKRAVEGFTLDKKTKCKTKCQKLKGGGTGCYCRDPPNERDEIDVERAMDELDSVGGEEDVMRNVDHPKSIVASPAMLERDHSARADQQIIQEVEVSEQRRVAT
ncbi:hypothetical protein BDZ90DRAFT_174699 [Jaminaea rosea]|uniref:Uncharacterized protein n=1 Tax=Jaminaea rosea TaxID=1569628 RepID=A0A316UPQ3_9BASI|nr:hypothetical protein BDZ90DRAFT_174699 [Jaminaea rosea]PWN27282.1 hypothetical protein BDZ90DRAFT_174699 [Jaminaea rosea]